MRINIVITKIQFLWEKLVRKNCYLYSDIRYLSFATFVTGKRGEKRVFLFSFFPFFRTNKREIAALTLRKKLHHVPLFTQLCIQGKGRKKWTKRRLLAKELFQKEKKERRKLLTLTNMAKHLFSLQNPFSFSLLNPSKAHNRKLKLPFFDVIYVRLSR